MTILCLNMIVKNEMARLPRCLAALAPHIGAWVICDTGSTDGTKKFVKGFFQKRHIPGKLYEFPFVNFEQARNAAIEKAKSSGLMFDYLLFCDADMELMVEDKGWAKALDKAVYSIKQKSVGATYWNTRLIRRDVEASFRGVTHEYLEFKASHDHLDGVWYLDHADGANRKDKFERDIRLLEAALEADPDNPRSWFYLAQSYKDAGRYKDAVQAYAKRSRMADGWDEEAWYAHLQCARCLLIAGDEAAFIKEAIACHDRRPGRAEPLYNLAIYYRQKGMFTAAGAFASLGVALPFPQADRMFVEHWIYEVGMKEEFSIAAWHSTDEATRERGRATCQWLADNATGQEQVRAKANLLAYNQSRKAA